MDSKNPTSPGQTNTPAVKPAQPFIQTMQKDIERLSKQAPAPSNLPLPPLPKPVEGIQKKAVIEEKDKQEQARVQKIQEEEERRKKEAEEKAQKEEKARKETEERRIKEERARKQTEEKTRKEAEEKAKEEAERRKKEEKRLAKKEEKKRLEEERLRNKITAKRKKREEKLARKEEKKRLKALRKQQGKGRSKFVFIILIIALIIIGGGAGFFYWWNYIYIPPVLTHFECKNYQCLEVEGEGADKCSSEAECLPPLPDSLIPVDETETIKILSGQENLLLEKIEAIALEKQEKGALKRILVQLTNGEKEYASLLKLKDMIGIEIPPEIMAKLKNYTLFIYKPEMSEAEKCQEADISDIKCYGPRLGMVLQTTDMTSLKDLMKEWEKTMVDDLRPLILATSTEKTLEFQDDLNPVYPETDTRYKNLPISPIALNYAFFEDLLIIGTSKYSLYHALDILIASAMIDTTTWKTYQNEEYGFEISFSKDFRQKEDNKNSKLFIRKDGHFWIFIEDNSKNLDAEGLRDDYYENDMYGYQYQDSFLLIDGINSYKQGRYDLGVIENYYIPTHNEVYKITFEFNFGTPNQELKKRKINLIDQILSTFKFTK